MHRLITTEAFVLHTVPRGESNRVYKLLTRELGLLYAHAQSVRELKSRNRYALQTGQMILVTLVRGKEVWRVTGARAIPEEAKQRTNTRSRKMLDLLGKMLPVEDPSVRAFDILAVGREALHSVPDEDELIEAITIYRLLDVLGYVPRPIDDVVTATLLENESFPEIVLRAAREHRRDLYRRVNTALLEAGP